MFEREIAVNQFLLGMFEKIVCDIPEQSLYEHFPGHGHSPVWLLGHLGLVAEMGQKGLGGTLAHPRWLPMFGPGSVDKIDQQPDLNKSALTAHVIDGYRKFQELAAIAIEAPMSRSHNIDLFDGTPIKTVGDCITHLLTSHFNFHLAQLSSCRRSGGHSFLF